MADKTTENLNWLVYMSLMETYDYVIGYHPEESDDERSIEEWIEKAELASIYRKF